ncbi:hypothetical protein E3N88_28370 [Mikania micrantha]|uniref:Uncharacterized protein n=1 Tax=Mikania micrantha TaxID=192012 RepID=A0A5N6MZ96_9ASTR|nr:hypothetical protein E3N88_28370 [Mikania micrantha]
MPDVKQWFEAFLDGDMTEIQYLLRDGEGDGIKNIIDKDGNSILHIAVALGRKDIIKKILWNIDGDNLTKIKNKKGSTVLHIAAIVGNTDVAKLLLKEDINLLHIKDNLGKKPLLKAYENMRLETAYLLLKATNDEKIRAKNAPTDDQNSPLKSNHVADGGKNAATVHQNSTLKSNTHDEDFSTGIGVLVQAISAKQYGTMDQHEKYCCGWVVLAAMVGPSPELGMDSVAEPNKEEQASRDKEPEGLEDVPETEPLGQIHVNG